MTVEARVRFRHRGCISETLTGGAQVARVEPDGDAEVLVMGGTDEGQVTRFHHALQALHHPAPEVLSRAPTSLVVRVRGPSRCVAPEALEAGCAVVWPAIHRNGEEHYTLRAPSRERLDALLERLGRMGEVVVEKLSEAAAPRPQGTPLADLTAHLTERQLSVLLRAIEDGYYDSPRRTSAEALAAAHGVTRTTLEEHLRKAERRVLEGFAAAMRAQPALAQGATRKPGRPPRVPQGASTREAPD